MARPALIPAFVFAVGVSALASALFTQHVLGFLPCTLCLWQRVPYVLALALGAFALGPWHSDASRRLALAVAGLVFFSGAGIALFHAGVEAHWWTWQSECTGDLGGVDSIEELRKRLMATPVVRCDEVPFRILGLSMAGWNAVMSPLFALVALWGALKFKSSPGA
ncbi:MAG: disulfide bond formation protein B [Rhodospirillales bacterium]|nr:MAG: disulfide bond formation protein B [Rhodospirillales bacterium]